MGSMKEAGMIPEEAVVIHVHQDIEAHARSYNEGYDAAVTQGLADDPSLADDWFAGKIREARAQALLDAADELDELASNASYDGSEDIMETWLNAATKLRARAVTERGGE